MLGDKGSGAWIGLEAVKAILLADDQLGQQTLLTKVICDKLECKPLDLIELLSKAASSDFAKLAPAVFECVERGDELATEIIQSGAHYIENLARKLLVNKPPRLSMIGGISPLLVEWFKEDLIEQILPPLDQPEQGALYFARAEFDKQNQSVAVG